MQSWYNAMDTTAPHEGPEEGRYSVRASVTQAMTGEHVLKHAETFAVFDLHGNISPTGGEQGVYHRGTRHLSRLQLGLDTPQMGNRWPVLLDSSVRKDSGLLVTDFTNPAFEDADGRHTPQGALHFNRSKLLWEGACYEHLRLRNHGLKPIQLAFTLSLAADFVDIFEVRGFRRERHGEELPATADTDYLELSYRGLDEVLRRTRVLFAPAPEVCSAAKVHFRVSLAPQDEANFYWTISCLQEAPSPSHAYKGIRTHTYEEAKVARRRGTESRMDDACAIVTSNDQFNEWINHSLNDLNLLLTEVSHGYYPFAGIPWYSTFFGRDGLLAALMTLWVNPDIARGVLAYLAEMQAEGTDPQTDAEPGKILHEARTGEVPALGEVPFKQYYGTVDATPLFVILASAYYRHVGDLAFIEKIWMNVERALVWMSEYGDVDGDGFLEYHTTKQIGLRNQGWKDSDDSVFHADGRLADGPIALSEVQGYAYAAKKGGAFLAEQLGRTDRAETLREEAKRLKKRFDHAFWCGDISAYALALDGEKRPCRVRSSNAGHALFTGIARAERVDGLANMLFAEDMFSGWGIRTLSGDERRYNPMAYHNGTVWPHDNALIGSGLGRYGYKILASRLLRALFDASTYMPRYRLPELFCGFIRRPEEDPTQYPVACAPQAWASAAVFCLLRACLGLTIRVDQKHLVFHHPTLPAFLQDVEVRNLRVGQGTVDLALQRNVNNVCVEVLRSDVDVQIVTVV